LIYRLSFFFLPADLESEHVNRAGGRRNGNRAVSGLNMPLKIRSTVKSL